MLRNIASRASYARAASALVSGANPATIQHGFTPKIPMMVRHKTDFTNLYATHIEERKAEGGRLRSHSFCTPSHTHTQHAAFKFLPQNNSRSTTS